MADGTARCGRYTVNVENQRGSIPLSVAKSMPLSSNGRTLKKVTLFRVHTAT